MHGWYGLYWLVNRDPSYFMAYEIITMYNWVVSSPIYSQPTRVLELWLGPRSFPRSVHKNMRARWFKVTYWPIVPKRSRSLNPLKSHLTITKRLQRIDRGRNAVSMAICCLFVIFLDGAQHFMYLFWTWRNLGNFHPFWKNGQPSHPLLASICEM